MDKQYTESAKIATDNAAQLKIYEVTIKKAQADSLHQEQLISKYTDSTNSLKKQLDENDNQTNQAEVIYRDKIKYVDTMSDDSLVSYFTALPCISQTLLTDNSGKKGNKSTVLCFQDSTIRKATELILKGQEVEKQLGVCNNSVSLLNKTVGFKDSIITAKSCIIYDQSMILNSVSGELSLFKSQNEYLKKKYTVLKTNDRLKMGFFYTIVAGLVYVYIEKR